MEILVIDFGISNNIQTRRIEIKMSNASEQQCINSANTILNLNDDVLRETFRNLNALELGAIADTCSAFKRNAQAEFSLRSKDLQFTNDHEHD